MKSFSSNVCLNWVFLRLNEKPFFDMEGQGMTNSTLTHLTCTRISIRCHASNHLLLRWKARGVVKGKGRSDAWHPHAYSCAHQASIIKESSMRNSKSRYLRSPSRIRCEESNTKFHKGEFPNVGCFRLP